MTHHVDYEAEEACTHQLSLHCCYDCRFRQVSAHRLMHTLITGIPNCVAPVVATAIHTGFSAFVALSVHSHYRPVNTPASLSNTVVFKSHAQMYVMASTLGLWTPQQVVQQVQEDVRPFCIYNEDTNYFGLPSPERLAAMHIVVCTCTAAGTPPLSANAHGSGFNVQGLVVEHACCVCSLLSACSHAAGLFGKNDLGYTASGCANQQCASYFMSCQGRNDPGPALMPCGSAPRAHSTTITANLSPEPVFGALFGKGPLLTMPLPSSCMRFCFCSLCHHCAIPALLCPIQPCLALPFSLAADALPCSAMSSPSLPCPAPFCLTLPCAALCHSAPPCPALPCAILR